MLKKVISCLRLEKRLFSQKRKYPINPEESKSLPIFDYGGSSKSTYRRVFVWGNLQSGALGVAYKKKDEKSMREYLKSPRRLTFAEKFQVTTAACGFGFTAFAVETETGSELYGTGLNTDSQIGQHMIRHGHPLEIIYFPQKIHLPIKPGTKIKKISAGRAHLLVLTTEGLFLLGNNSYGQCSRKIVQDENYFLSNYINHVKKLEGKSIIDIECGQDHSLALTEDGAVYSCGWGADGQTGLGNYQNTSYFQKVSGDLTNEKIIKVSSRSDFVLALSDKGQVFGWGNAEYHQVPTPSGDQQVCQPVHLKHLDNLGRIKDVAAASSFCIVLNQDHEVFTWGFGILGVGPKVENSAHPIMLPTTLFGKNYFQTDNNVVSIKCGLSYGVAVTSLGEVYSWGRNTRCCLGLGSDKDQFFPLKVSIAGHVVDVFCGYDHTITICKPFI